ncbi:MAG: 2-amino-4-hydroxy-6-hydroxymethyldihydropteridine diphosphokinase [Candidatus Sphingomonas colombiensis]|nr:2-amino-4-hydroxy-6-hydroxymethyldihydropteridine diphosphokinase [Sphingomonas sp.]WEK41941.1 MAG: 2-amino-4-hydroxy-6-hydroxymethyldihydropteridine diphosphokinase [Sphingomonas sp.]
MTQSYLIALGSNRRGRHGDPRAELRAALAAIGAKHMSPIITSAPLGPSNRAYANAVALIESDDTPPELLVRLKKIEHAFGRRRGRRWGARVIDLDIIAWSGGIWRSPGLVIPHVALRERDFVLRPLADLAPSWRDPVTGLNAKQLHTRLTRRRALPNRRGAGEGP